jgi:hypothetical protein
MKSAAPNGAFIFSAIRTARPQGARRFYFCERFCDAVNVTGSPGIRLPSETLPREGEFVCVIQQMESCVDLVLSQVAVEVSELASLCPKENWPTIPRRTHARQDSIEMGRALRGAGIFS